MRVKALNVEVWHVVAVVLSSRVPHLVAAHDGCIVIIRNTEALVVVVAQPHGRLDFALLVERCTMPASCAT